MILADSRAAAPALWTVLHSLDYYLTLWTVRIHRAGVDQRLNLGGSVELNPVMRGALERRSLFSWRFTITLLGMAAGLWFLWPLAAEEEWAWQLILGGIIFSRLSVIGHHVHNIVWFRALQRGEIQGKLEYPRPTLLKLSSLRYGAETVTLWAAAALTRSWWLVGGAATMSALVGVMVARVAWEWLRSGRRSA